MPTVFLLLDAFRSDYLSEETTPFLSECASKGRHYVSVEPSLGYCERAEILTGLSSKEAGFFSAVGFDPNNSPYKRIKMLKILDCFENILLLFLKFFPITLSAKIQKKFRKIVQRYFMWCGVHMPPFLIPFKWLKYFALTEDRLDHRSADAFSVPSILTLLNSQGKEFFYDSFTALGFPAPYSSDQDRLDAVAKNLTYEQKELYLVYISAPDAYGHLYGPDALEFKEKLNDMDNNLKKFVEECVELSPNTKFIFVGDHGMMTVKQKFNAEREIKTLLKRARLKLGIDVIYFLDSTSVRLWSLSQKAQTKLAEILPAADKFHDYGTWMNSELSNEIEIAWPDPRYGEHLWVANPGVLVFPDFFHRFKPQKGMHGYDVKLKESKGTCILWSKDIANETIPDIRLTDIYDILRRELNL
jgi:predicted AlkP superfamily pyrophosphatase or phosphodiesterase